MMTWQIFPFLSRELLHNYCTAKNALFVNEPEDSVSPLKKVTAFLLYVVHSTCRYLANHK